MDIDERIRRVEQQKASRAEEEQRQSQERSRQHHHEMMMKKQDREQTCKRILRESSVLVILEQLRAKRLAGREKKVALVVRHERDGSGIHVTLAWGKEFTVEHDMVTSTKVTEGFFNKMVYDVYDYSSIEVDISPFSESITVTGKDGPFMSDKVERIVPYSDIDAIADAIAEVFLNPCRHGPSKDWHNPSPPDPRSGIGGYG